MIAVTGTAIVAVPVPDRAAGVDRIHEDVAVEDVLRPETAIEIVPARRTRNVIRNVRGSARSVDCRRSRRNISVVRLLVKVERGGVLLFGRNRSNSRIPNSCNGSDRSNLKEKSSDYTAIVCNVFSARDETQEDDIILTRDYFFIARAV